MNQTCKSQAANSAHKFWQENLWDHYISNETTLLQCSRETLSNFYHIYSKCYMKASITSIIITTSSVIYKERHLLFLGVGQYGLGLCRCASNDNSAVTTRTWANYRHLSYLSSVREGGIWIPVGTQKKAGTAGKYKRQDIRVGQKFIMKGSVICAPHLFIFLWHYSPRLA